MNVRINRNDARISARINSGKSNLVRVVTNQVIKDGNYYCRQDQSILISSSYSASQPEKGLAVWETPYAKRVYYTGTPVTSKNPNASPMWVEKARHTFGADWQMIAQKALREGMD